MLLPREAQSAKALAWVPGNLSAGPVFVPDCATKTVIDTFLDLCFLEFKALSISLKTL